MRNLITFFIAPLMWLIFCLAGAVGFNYYVNHVRTQTVQVKYEYGEISQAIRNTVHVIEFDRQKLGAGGDFGTLCTAWALAPHALLSATHCERPTGKITVDGKAAELVSVIRDDDDHSIFLIRGITLKVTGSYNFREPVLGERVFYWGNPDGAKNIYREGVYAGSRVTPEDGIGYLLTAKSAPGDSGAPVFDAAGIVVGVESASWLQVFSVMYPVKFTTAQLQQAQTFK